MTRLLTTVLAIAAGFAAAWAGGTAAGNVDWPLQPYRGCYEIDACDVPWWIVALFMGWLIGPAILYGSTVWFGTGRAWPTQRWAVVAAVLLAVTIAFYASWPIYRSLH